MNFIEEEDFLFLQRSEDGSEVAFAFKERPGAGLDNHAEFVGNDLCEGGFPEAGRPIEQNVVEGFAAAARGFDRNSRPVRLHLRAGVPSAARVTRSSFSQLEAPASRLASARAVSAVRSS